MKLAVFFSLFIVFGLIEGQDYMKCIDNDPFVCQLNCGPLEIHTCTNDYCTCRFGPHCNDTHTCPYTGCANADQHMHCLESECHCLKIDELDNSD